MFKSLKQTVGEYKR